MSPSLPADPEGARAPLQSAAPYYVKEYVPGERLLLERNRFYKGPRPHHVDRFVADLTANDNTIIDAIASGKLDWGWSAGTLRERAAELKQRYGANKSQGQFYVQPANGIRMFVLNTSRPLFRKNPKLRQAINFAVDRRELTREIGALAGTPTDQYLSPSQPGYTDERMYPLKEPDLSRASALAKGRTRSGKAVLYTSNIPPNVAQAQVLQQNLKAIGIAVEIVTFPGTLLFEKLQTDRQAFDIGSRWLPGLRRRPLVVRGHLRRADDRRSRQPELVLLQLAEVQPAVRRGGEADRATSVTGPTARWTCSSRGMPRLRSRCEPQRTHVRLGSNRLRRRQPVPRPDRGLPQVTRALAATLFAALVLIPAAGTHGIKEGGTFRVGTNVFSIDPSSAEASHVRLTCASLMTFPPEPPPEGLPARARCRRRLSEGDERRQDVHVHDPKGSPFLDRLAGDGPLLRPHDQPPAQPDDEGAARPGRFTTSSARRR